MEASHHMPDIRFEFNKPVTLSILDPDRDCQHYDDGLAASWYETTDGRRFTLPRPAVILLNELEVQPGEEIGICRKAAMGRPAWSIWLTPKTEQARAAQEQADSKPELPSDTEYLLEASLRKVADQKASQQPRKAEKQAIPIRKRPAKEDQPRLFDRGTGTDGPAPRPATPLPASTLKTPYREMLLHIVRSVEWALNEAGIQLGDAPKQDLYSTIYIDAAKRSGVDYDFSREAE